LITVPARQKISSVRYAKDLLDVATMPRQQVLDLLRLATSLKKKQHRGSPHRLLNGKTLGLLFQKPSTRTRVSFEAGMNQLGGHALVLGRDRNPNL
jgi:ornithine carbamoyltransferase